MTRHSARPAGAPWLDRYRIALLVFLASSSFGSFAFPAVLAAQEAETVPVTIRLRDAETNEVLMGALVELRGQSRRYVTGMDGRVSFEVPMGRYALTAHKGGYATLRGDFRVTRAGHLTFLMHELGDVDTSIPERLLVRVAEFGSGRLIEGAAVSLFGGQARMTDGHGWVEFREVSGPVAEVTVEMFGYEKRTEPVSLQEGRTTVLEVAMAIDAVVLAPLEVTAQSRYLEKWGVYWRIDHNRVMHLFDTEDLIERGTPHLVDAFRGLPSLHVIGLWPLVRITGPRQCEIAWYWDGMPMINPYGSLEDIPREAIALVEVYTGIRTPSRFSRGPGDINTCGAIVFWSRRRADRSR